MVGVCFDAQTSAPPDAPAMPTLGDVITALRGEALPQLHWQQGEWERHLATEPPGAPCLILLAHGAGLNNGLGLLRHVPLAKDGLDKAAKGVAT